jgi:23S rRNA (uracil1939-C5)-methyltransferase
MNVTIDRLGMHGDGIAPGPVYVARTLPGEVIAGEIEGDRIAAPKIVTPSEMRVKAPCPHYARCGGCALQHARNDFVGTWKQNVVVTALAAHGIETEFRPLISSSPRSRRRATFSGRRLKSGALVGFHTRASDTLVPIPDCHLLHDDLRGALPMLEALTGIVGSRKGEVSFAVALSEAGLDVDMATTREVDAKLVTDLAELAREFDLARLSQRGDTILTRRAPHVLFDGMRVVPPPGGFLQATPEGEAALRAAITEAVGPAKQITDLFAGSGTFALPLARTAQVHAVEAVAAMTEALHLGWREAKRVKNLTVETRDLFRRPLLPDELRKTDAVVIDPPRAGAEAQVAELAKAQVGRIAFVSCNPVTFARDAKTLQQAGYRLNWVQVVDQFRWSPHIELAASLTAPHIAA